MRKIVSPFTVKGTIQVAASKSYLQRYMALASLFHHKTTIQNINYCNDVRVAIDIIRQMGSKVSGMEENTVEITGISNERKYRKIEIDVGESGLCARMFGIILPVMFKNVVIQAKDSLLRRSMHSLINVLEKAGCVVKSNNGYLPLRIQGFANYNQTEVRSLDTSQIITGLLFASIVPNRDIEFRTEGTVSLPYIDLSIAAARLFGVNIRHSADYKKYQVKTHPNTNHINIIVEGDWSNAAFFAVGAALSVECSLHHLNKNSFQGDKKIIEILQMCGTEIKWEQGDVLFIKKRKITPIQTDLTHHPDLFPPICVLALGIPGVSIIKGVSRLHNKESNRAESLQKVFSDLGGDVKLEGNQMIIKGTGHLNGGVVDSYNDHRISMAAAISGVISENKIMIENAEAVNKSYPEFFDHLSKVSN